MSNIVYIATSLDGFIADKNGGLDWLHSTPNPDNDDFGFADFMANIDALIMGRNTFEVVCGFDVDWPYNKPVYVLSSSLDRAPEALAGKVEIISGSVSDIIDSLNKKGHHRFYIDGGKTIQSFMQADMIDEMIITRLPVVLGGGIPLFGSLESPLVLEHVDTRVLLNALVQSHYRCIYRFSGRSKAIDC